MYKRIQFSTSIQSIIEKQQQSTKSSSKPDINESLPKREEVIKLLEKIKSLEDNAFRNYYIIKVNKLLGKLSIMEKKFNETFKYYDEAAKISAESFGDCLELTAKHLGKNSEKKIQDKAKAGEMYKNAKEKFKDAFSMAERIGLINQTKVFTTRMNTLLLAYADFCLKSDNMKEEAKDSLQKIINGYFDYGYNGYLCEAIQKWCSNYKEYPENLEKISLEFDRNFIKMVDEVLNVLIKITDKSEEESEIKKTANIGKTFLTAAIKVASQTNAKSKEEEKSLEEALYRWNKDIALRCGHVILESERKKYATEAWNIAENKGYAKEMERNYLTLVKKANRSKEEEEMILKVTMLENIHKVLKEEGKQAQQKKELEETLKSCQWDWLKMKLLVCLLEIDSKDSHDKISLMENASDIMSKCSLVSLKSFDVLKCCLSEFKYIDLADVTKKRLCRISQKCTKGLENIKRSRKNDSLKKEFHRFSKHYCDST